MGDVAEELPIQNPPQEDGAIEEETQEEQEEGVDPRLIRLMYGDLNDVPPLMSKIVRIFTSSTFTDTTTERNCLMEKVYPRIKEYCRNKHGLEFQVVDMRWGVRDEATDDHMTTELCMTEIENCQRLSVGPNFIVFLGQKYGYRPIPTIIPAADMELIEGVVKNEPADFTLLRRWYKRDENQVPHIYILQPISSILINFNNKRHQKLMEADQNAWWDIMGKLQLMFRKAAQVLLMARQFDREQMHNFFMSVTEREVRKGIINGKDTKLHCLAYVRIIENINLNLLRFCRNFIDMITRDVDFEAQKLLTNLRDVLLAQKLVEENTRKFTVEWEGKEGIDRKTHKEYLDIFCDMFHNDTLRLIDQGMADQQKLVLSQEPVYFEVQQHSVACNKAIVDFLGREEEMERVKNYLLDDSTQPLIMYGPGGSGKTSFLAKAFSMISKWMPPNRTPIKMLRFLGTSPDSSRVVPLLKSLIEQITMLLENEPKRKLPYEISPLTTMFKKTLMMANEETPFVIFLDSLDMLDPLDGAHELAWFPINLPPWVKVVASTSQEYYGILEKMQGLITNDAHYIEVKPLGEPLAKRVLLKWLETSHRAISKEQMLIVETAFSKCTLPLFVKLVFDEVYRWRSYSNPRYTTLSFTIHDSIMKLLDRVENQHGKVLVSHALGYLTAAKSGLSEAELEDLLSLDEKVLNDVYQYHLPPVRRIPPLLWTRIRNEMPAYFIEREADGVNVVSWYHRQFIEASRERYFKNMNFLSEVHSNIATYFEGTWFGRPKPFTYSELQRQRFFLSNVNGECDRHVPDQPLYYTDDKGKITRFNNRKLSELPYHLIRSKRFDDLYREVLFNFGFLHAKLSGMPLTSLLEDIEDTLEVAFDKNLKILADTLRLSASFLAAHPDMTGPQIVGRLLPYYDHYDKIQQLIEQCDSDGLKINALVPSYHCLHTPGGPLQFSLEGHKFAPFGIAMTSDARYLVSVSNIFILFDLATGEVFRIITPGIRGIMQNLCISPDNKTAVSFTNNNQIVICYLKTGEHKLLDLPVNVNQTTMGTQVTDTHLLAFTMQEWFVYMLNGTLLAQGKVNKKQVMINDVQMGTIPEKDINIVTKSLHPLPEIENERELALITKNGVDEDSQPLQCHSSIAITKDGQRFYSCITISDHNVVCYKRSEANSWKYDRTLGENDEPVFALTLSYDEKHLVATIKPGFKLWDLTRDRQRELLLPINTRNIPSKHGLTSLVVFSRNSHFVVAAVRRIIYVWDVKVGNLVKTLDAHFARIIGLVTVPAVNKVISASIDKTIKVWNFTNILENVYSIYRHEKPIEAISLAANAYIGATVTRNCVGVWNLENGELIRTLASSAHSAIVTHAIITGNAKYLVSAESGNIIMWEVDTGNKLASDEQKDVLQLFLSDKDKRCIAISKIDDTTFHCVCRAVPGGKIYYQFDYTAKCFKNAVVSCDGLFLCIPTHEYIGSQYEHNMLSVYHARSGIKLHETWLKWNDYVDFTHLVAMPHDGHLMAFIDPEKGNVWDIKKKHVTRQIRRWNGVCTRNGKYGLYAPNVGGMELLELKHGRTVHNLMPRVAEGVFDVKTMFTRSDQHVIHYHAARRSVRVFRMSDGRQIADYTAHAEIKAIDSTQGGIALVLGAVDGSLIVLVIGDQKNQASIDFLRQLPSRQKRNEKEQIEMPKAPPPKAKKSKFLLQIESEIAAEEAEERGSDFDSDDEADDDDKASADESSDAKNSTNSTENESQSQDQAKIISERSILDVNGAAQLGTVAQVARAVGKARTAQKSQACILS